MRNAAQKNLGLLHAINNGGKLPAFADGGQVGGGSVPTFSGGGVSSGAGMTVHAPITITGTGSPAQNKEQAEMAARHVEDTVRRILGRRSAPAIPPWRHPQPRQLLNRFHYQKFGVILVRQYVSELPMSAIYKLHPARDAQLRRSPPLRASRRVPPSISASTTRSSVVSCRIFCPGSRRGPKVPRSLSRLEGRSCHSCRRPPRGAWRPF